MGIDYKRCCASCGLKKYKYDGTRPKGMQEMAVMRRAKECRKEVGCGQGHRNKGGRFLTI